MGIIKGTSDRLLKSERFYRFEGDHGYYEELFAKIYEGKDGRYLQFEFVVNGEKEDIPDHFLQKYIKKGLSMLRENP